MSLGKVEEGRLQLEDEPPRPGAETRSEEAAVERRISASSVEANLCGSSTSACSSDSETGESSALAKKVPEESSTREEAYEHIRLVTLHFPEQLPTSDNSKVTMADMTKDGDAQGADDSATRNEAQEGEILSGSFLLEEHQSSNLDGLTSTLENLSESWTDPSSLPPIEQHTLERMASEKGLVVQDGRQEGLGESDRGATADDLEKRSLSFSDTCFEVMDCGASLGEEETVPPSSEAAQGEEMAETSAVSPTLALESSSKNKEKELVDVKISMPDWDSLVRHTLSVRPPSLAMVELPTHLREAVEQPLSVPVRGLSGELNGFFRNVGFVAGPQDEGMRVNNQVLEEPRARAAEFPESKQPSRLRELSPVAVSLNENSRLCSRIKSRQSEWALQPNFPPSPSACDTPTRRTPRRTAVLDTTSYRTPPTLSPHDFCVEGTGKEDLCFGPSKSLSSAFSDDNSKMQESGRAQVHSGPVKGECISPRFTERRGFETMEKETFDAKCMLMTPPATPMSGPLLRVLLRDSGSVRDRPTRPYLSQLELHLQGPQRRLASPIAPILNEASKETSETPRPSGAGNAHRLSSSPAPTMAASASDEENIRKSECPRDETRHDEEQKEWSSERKDAPSLWTSEASNRVPSVSIDRVSPGIVDGKPPREKFQISSTNSQDKKESGSLSGAESRHFREDPPATLNSAIEERNDDCPSFGAIPQDDGKQFVYVHRSVFENKAEESRLSDGDSHALKSSWPSLNLIKKNPPVCGSISSIRRESQSPSGTPASASSNCSPPWRISNLDIFSQEEENETPTGSRCAVASELKVPSEDGESSSSPKVWTPLNMTHPQALLRRVDPSASACPAPTVLPEKKMWVGTSPSHRSVETVAVPSFGPNGVELVDLQQVATISPSRGLKNNPSGALKAGAIPTEFVCPSSPVEGLVSPHRASRLSLPVAVSPRCVPLASQSPPPSLFEKLQEEGDSAFHSRQFPVSAGPSMQNSKWQRPFFDSKVATDCSSSVGRPHVALSSQVSRQGQSENPLVGPSFQIPVALVYPQVKSSPPSNGRVSSAAELPSQSRFVAQVAASSDRCFVQRVLKNPQVKPVGPFPAPSVVAFKPTVSRNAELQKTSVPTQSSIKGKASFVSDSNRPDAPNRRLFLGGTRRLFGGHKRHSESNFKFDHSPQGAVLSEVPKSPRQSASQRETVKRHRAFVCTLYPPSGVCQCESCCLCDCEFADKREQCPLSPASALLSPREFGCSPCCGDRSGRNSSSVHCVAKQVASLTGQVVKTVGVGLVSTLGRFVWELGSALAEEAVEFVKEAVVCAPQTQPPLHRAVFTVSSPAPPSSPTSGAWLRTPSPQLKTNSSVTPPTSAKSPRGEDEAGKEREEGETCREDGAVISREEELLQLDEEASKPKEEENDDAARDLQESSSAILQTMHATEPPPFTPKEDLPAKNPRIKVPLPPLELESDIPEELSDDSEDEDVREASKRLSARCLVTSARTS